VDGGAEDMQQWHSWVCVFNLRSELVVQKQGFVTDDFYSSPLAQEQQSIGDLLNTSDEDFS